MTKSYAWLRSLLLCGITILVSTPAHAQITPDNTLGAESSRLTPNALINGASADRIDGGAARGSNLFHSFSEFNVGDGQRVYFGNPTGIQNILTRVTGKNASSILGTLGVDGGANLFLLNPNGIIFGQNASLDLRGSFVGTTANAIGFGEQGFFSATDPNSPPLLTVQPAALLYTQINGGAIANQSQAPAGVNPNSENITSLRVPDGKSLLLVGGNVNLDGGRLRADGGRIELTGLAAPGSIGLNVTGNTLSLNVPNDVPRADVSLTNNAFASVFGAGGGDIAINARKLDVLGGSWLGAGIMPGLGSVTSQAGDITLNATGTITIAKNNSESGGISNVVSPSAVGKGGNINIQAESLAVNDGAIVQADTFGQGDAGSVNINARDTVSLDGESQVLSRVYPGAVGNSGGINVTTRSLSVTDGAFLSTSTYGQGNASSVLVQAQDSVALGNQAVIFSSVGPGGVGDGGDINVTARSLSLTEGSVLNAQTRGQGNAGSVTVTASDTISFDGEDSAGNNSGVVSTVSDGAVGNGGNINITTGSLSGTNGAEIVASTFGEGNAGSVTITASDTISFDGKGKDEYSSGVFSTVQSETVGNGGGINITTGSLFLTNGAEISASTFGEGNAGSVFVQALDSVSVASNSDIFSSVEPGGVGNGGNINITAPTLSLTDGGQLGTLVSEASNNLPAGEGIAGDVFVDVSGNVTISGVNSPSGIVSYLGTGAKGKGGNVNVNATGSLSVTDGAQLVASTYGIGDAGNIQINATNSISVSGTNSSSGYSSALFTNTYPDSTGIGGDIAVNTNVLRVSDGAVLNAGTQNNSNSGNITVKARQVEAINGGQFLTSTSGSGNAGKITVNASDSVTVNGSDPTFNDRVAQFGDLVANPEAASGLFVRSQASGIAGDIEVTSPQIRLDNGGKLNAESASGNGGDINIINSDLLLLRRNSNISTNAGQDRGAGNGGNININAKTIAAVPKENSDITAKAFSGRGGNVTINTNGLFGIVPADFSIPQSDITASSELGVQGQIDITQPDVQPTQGLVELPVQVLDASDQIAQTCPSGANAKRPLGEFVVTGRGGSLPPNPLEPLAGSTSLSPLASIDGVSQANQPSQTSSQPVSTTTPTKIVEAQGWIKTPDGKIALVANAPQATPLATTTQATCQLSK